MAWCRVEALLRQALREWIPASAGMMMMRSGVGSRSSSMEMPFQGGT
jgi:hypothetical protein